MVNFYNFFINCDNEDCGYDNCPANVYDVAGILTSYTYSIVSTLIFLELTLVVKKQGQRPMKTALKNSGS